MRQPSSTAERDGLRYNPAGAMDLLPGIDITECSRDMALCAQASARLHWFALAQPLSFVALLAGSFLLGALAYLLGKARDSAHVQVGLAIAVGGVFVGAGDFQRGGQRDGAALHAFDQAFLPLVEQEDDVFDVLGRQAGLLDDDLGAVAAFAQHLDVGQDLQRAVAAPGDVFGQAHDEGVFIAHVHYQGGDVGFAQDAEGVQAPFPANQQVFGLTVVTGPLGHGDGLFEADELDAFDDLLKDLHVAVAGVEHLDARDGHHAHVFWGVGHHVGLRDVWVGVVCMG